MKERERADRPVFYRRATAAGIRAIDRYRAFRTNARSPHARATATCPTTARSDRSRPVSIASRGWKRGVVVIRLHRRALAIECAARAHRIATCARRRFFSCVTYTDVVCSDRASSCRATSSGTSAAAALRRSKRAISSRAVRGSPNAPIGARPPAAARRRPLATARMRRRVSSNEEKSDE